MLLQFEELKQKLSALEPQLKDIEAAMGLEADRTKIAELEKTAADPNSWGDVEGTSKILRQIRRLKDKEDTFNSLRRAFDDCMATIDIALELDDDSLYDEALELYTKFEANLETQKLTTLLSGEYDGKNAILTFHAGAGGVEAQDWTQMLYRMYTRWAERHGCKYSILDYLDGEEAGIKSASILIEGVNVYGFLKSEAGVHRLVRISPFDASGRRHTSFASLDVMPEIDDDSTIVIKEEDLKVDTYRSSGAGGQHVNKTESAIRITHLPTGIVVACQNERSQHQNREVAMKMLRSKLAEIKEREHLEKVEDIKGEQMVIAWGSQIRSYVFMPYTLAKDHRTNFESGNINAVMDGEIDGFINAYLKALSLGQLQA